MAARTPGLQPRSAYHAYWGQYQYRAIDASNSFAGRTADIGADNLPNSTNNVLNATEFAKLEAGDTAATVDASSPVTGTEFGLWTCIRPGTLTGGDAVWVRMDQGAGITTIRDAHRIVVGITGADAVTPATNALLNLDPYIAGYSADFIDVGDGAAFALALAAATTITAQGTSVDLRIVSGAIDFSLTGAVALPLGVPTNCRVLGAGKNLTEITGLNALGADQRIFLLAQDASVEGLTLISKTPVGAAAASTGGIITSNRDFSVRDVHIIIEDSVNRSTRKGIEGSSFEVTASKAYIERVSIQFDGARVNSEGVSLQDYGYSTLRDVDCADMYQAVHLLSVSVPNVGNRLSNLSGQRLHRSGIIVESQNASLMTQLTVADSAFSFKPDATTLQQCVFEGRSLNTSMIKQVNLSGIHVEWPANSIVAARAFAILDAEDTSSMQGLSFLGCGIVSGSLLNFTEPTNGVIITNASAVADAIRGGDLLCDFAGSGPLTAPDIILQTGSALWEHAHPKGLA